MMDLHARATPSASVTPTDAGGHRLFISDGDDRAYRLAQLDDYSTRPRRGFLWNEHTTLSLEARVCASPLTTSTSSVPHPDPATLAGTSPQKGRGEHCGTWGFGLWNDPFIVSFGMGGMARRLPALPNAAWFFFASHENHLSFQSHKPANGFMAQTFSAPRIPSLLLAPGAITLPLLMWRRASRLFRRVAGYFIHEDSVRLSVDPTRWHAYQLEWSPDRVAFRMDEALVLETKVSPHGPLGLVIWIDNQFAAWTPDGQLRAGIIANPSTALEVKKVVCHQ